MLLSISIGTLKIVELLQTDQLPLVLNRESSKTSRTCGQMLLHAQMASALFKSNGEDSNEVNCAFDINKEVFQRLDAVNVCFSTVET